MTAPELQQPITVGAVSVTGQRADNQDCMAAFLSPLGHAYLVADGMGGHRGGATASRIATDEFRRNLSAMPASADRGEALKGAVRAASEVIAQTGNADPALRGMGSTLVVALFFFDEATLSVHIAHAGDSRAYLFRDGRLQRLTRDHTQVQWMVDTGTLDEAAARLHPGSSVLTRALGVTANLEAEVSEAQTVLLGDTFLLCSDGLTGVANSAQILAVFEEEFNPASCAGALVELALAAGSDDNITVQVLRVGPDATTDVFIDP